MKLSFISITLTNFKGVTGPLSWRFHDQPGFYFVRGTNKKEPRLGGNGVGKTTLMIDAPYWILTGKTVLSARPGALVENWLDGRGTNGKLHISLDGEDYFIERGRNPSILQLNGETVTQDAIDKLLPLSDAALRRTLLLGQRSSLFLDLRPEDKARLFSETLDLDRWLLASDRAGDQVRTLDRVVAAKNSDLTSAVAVLNLLRDQHEVASRREGEFSSDRAVKLASLDQRIKECQNEADSVEDALSEARKAFDSLEASHASDEKTPSQHLAIARQRENSARGTLGRFEANLRTIRQQEQQLRSQVILYQKSRDCPECGQPITDQHAEKRIEELSVKAKELGEFGDQLAADANQFDRNLMELAQTIRDLEQKTAQSGEIKHEIDLLEMRSINSKRELERLTKERDSTAREENPFATICDGLEVKFVAEKARSGELEIEIEKLLQQVEIYKFWQKGFKDIRLELIDATLLELTLTTNRNAQALGLEDWNIEFATERETKSGSMSQAFTVLLYPPGQKEPIDWAAFSGGEAQRWHIAVTCGLSEVLLSRAGIEPDIEIYDEITNYISSEGIEDVMEFLRERAIELGRKIYLIDHHIGIGDFTAVVEIVKDTDGVRIENPIDIGERADLSLGHV